MTFGGGGIGRFHLALVLGLGFHLAVGFLPPWMHTTSGPGAPSSGPWCAGSKKKLHQNCQTCVGPVMFVSPCVQELFPCELLLEHVPKRWSAVENDSGVYVTCPLHMSPA